MKKAPPAPPAESKPDEPADASTENGTSSDTANIRAGAQLPPITTEVKYYKVAEYSRFCAPDGIATLQKDSIMTSLSHDIDEVRRQGVPIVEISEEEMLAIAARPGIGSVS